jgi:hypothetical protein
VLVANQSARILRRFGEEVLLVETHFRWEFERPYELKLEVCGMEIAGSVDEKEILRVKDRCLASIAEASGMFAKRDWY